MLSCIGESNTVSAASILFPWMQPVHLIFLRIVLTHWIIIVPWKPAHHQSIGLKYPQIHFCSNPPLPPQARQKKRRKKSTCMHATTCWHWDLSVDMTQSSIWWFYAIWRNLMYFEGFKCAAYRQRIPTGLTHWLAADGKDSHFMIICSTGMTCGATYMT